MEIFYALAVLALLSFAAGNERYRRQLPTPDCPLPEFTQKIEATPVDQATGSRLCWYSALNFTQIPATSYVEEQERVFSLLQKICSDECLPSIADLVNSCFRAYQAPLTLACASSGTLQCWQLPVINTGEDASSACYDNNNTVTTAATTCPQDCETELTELVSMGGCCVNNVFNTTVFGPELQGLGVTRNGLWEMCGMAKIQFCPVPPAFVDASAPPATTMSAGGVTPTGKLGLLVFLSLSVLFWQD